MAITAKVLQLGGVPVVTAFHRHPPSGSALLLAEPMCIAGYIKRKDALTACWQALMQRNWRVRQAAVAQRVFNFAGWAYSVAMHSIVVETSRPKPSR
jgi:hypothetical protein